MHIPTNTATYFHELGLQRADDIERALAGITSGTGIILHAFLKGGKEHVGAYCRAHAMRDITNIRRNGGLIAGVYPASEGIYDIVSKWRAFDNDHGYETEHGGDIIPVRAPIYKLLAESSDAQRDGDVPWLLVRQGSGDDRIDKIMSECLRNEQLIGRFYAPEESVSKWANALQGYLDTLEAHAELEQQASGDDYEATGFVIVSYGIGESIVDRILHDRRHDRSGLGLRVGFTGISFGSNDLGFGELFPGASPFASARP